MSCRDVRGREEDEDEDEDAGKDEEDDDEDDEEDVDACVDADADTVADAAPPKSTCISSASASVRRRRCMSERCAIVGGRRLALGS